MNTALDKTPAHAGKLINRPVITLPIRPCPNCGRAFVAAWGWLLLPTGQVSDLCGECSRHWRYCSIEQRHAEISALVARLRERRAAA